MAAKASQFKLLLWKDYLVRKRKLVTIAGIVWGTLVMLSLYIVRANVNDAQYPTCQFPARALPSAGMLTFMQSFICNINNECETMDKYDEVPSYEASRLTQLHRQLSPLISNETVMEVASVVPDALKLLGTVADAVDEPTFIEISKNGLRVKNLFRNIKEVKKFLRERLDFHDLMLDDLMDAKINFRSLFDGANNRCDSEFLSEVFLTKELNTIEVLVNKICPLSEEEMRVLLIDLIMQMDFSKYISMVGNMYSKLKSDRRISVLGDTMTAVMRLNNIHSFIPPEFVTLLTGTQDDQFRYFNLSIINKFIKIYEPIFGETDYYKTIEGVTDAAISGIQWLYRLISKQDSIKSIDEVSGLVLNQIDHQTVKKSNVTLPDEYSNAVNTFQSIVESENIFNDIFDVLPKIMQFAMKWIPKDDKHEVYFYSTLLSKLIDLANNIIVKNINLEEIVYNATMRNIQAVKVLTSLPVKVLNKAFDALSDAERTQVMTSKINDPAAMFCAAIRIQKFFLITKEESEKVKNLLCSDDWQKYVNDLMTSFGIYEVKSKINDMASLVIQETLGKDTSDQLYDTDQLFLSLRSLVRNIVNNNNKAKKQIEWYKALNLTKESEVMAVLNKRSEMGKEILITVHGALAKEIVTQNIILNLKIAPILKRMTVLVDAMNQELKRTPKLLIQEMKKYYPLMLETVLKTFLNEAKTYKLLSTPSLEMFCDGPNNVQMFLEINEENAFLLDQILCNASKIIDSGLTTNSIIGKTISNLADSSNDEGTVQWTKLINGLKTLYTTVYNNYTYVFEFKSFNMNDKEKEKIENLSVEVKKFWFDVNHIPRGVQLSINSIFRILDVVNREIFALDEDNWFQFKNAINASNGLLVICDEFVQLFNSINSNDTSNIDLPPSTVIALRKILPNIPTLIRDTADLIYRDDTDIEPVIELMNSDPGWPCSKTSLSTLVTISEASKDAVIGLESLLCMNKSLREEWEDYIELQRIRMFENLNQKQSYGDSLFLKFSKNFNALINDTSILQDNLKLMFNEEKSKDEKSFVGAWKYAVKVFDVPEKGDKMRNFTRKIDIILNAINTTEINTSLPLTVIWEDLASCYSYNSTCFERGRYAWIYTLKFMSVALNDMARDLSIYFREANEPNATIIQIMGFTKETGLYILYEKIVDFVGVLLNSYWDFGFMNQIRRASKSSFWDCDAVVDALVIPMDSPITQYDIKKIKPYICPSFLYWVSLPRGENSILDVIAKPQYYFYTVPSQNLTSKYEVVYTNMADLIEVLGNISKKDLKKIIPKEELNLNTTEHKYLKVIDNIMNWILSTEDAGYKLFKEINSKQFISSIYLTKVVAIFNQILTAFEEFNFDEITIDNRTKVEEELNYLVKKFKRRPTEALLVHFDLITDMIWRNNENYLLKDVIKEKCNAIKTNDTVKIILAEDQRLMAQICSRNYLSIYKETDMIMRQEINNTRYLLNSMVDLLNFEDRGDIYEIFGSRKSLINTLKLSIKYADDLGTPIYLKYLEINLQNYEIIMSFLNGKDWWNRLRDLYNGPKAKSFFDAAENSIIIANDFLINLDQIHIVRLLRDMNFNDTEIFCMENVTMSDYIPDITGHLSLMKQQICDLDQSELFPEIPIMAAVSQGYDNSLILSKEINYTKLDEQIKNMTESLLLLKNGPKTPKTPEWITNQDLNLFRKSAEKLLKKESLIKIGFGVISNIVDGSTLFLNASYCESCSILTKWVKQFNLQLYKKAEYDTLLCNMDSMTLHEIHSTLKNDFHWHMAIQELTLSRNYTKWELNKSLNEFFHHVKLYLYEDITSNTTKLAKCLNGNVTRNEVGNATLFLSVITKTLRLLRSQMPYLQDIESLKKLDMFKTMYDHVSHRLHVEVPLKDILGDDMAKKSIGSVDDVFVDIMEFKNNPENINRWLKSNLSAVEFCQLNQCEKLVEATKKISMKTINNQLKKYQDISFWKFDFVSNILKRLERFIENFKRILSVVSKIDLEAFGKGKLDAILDLVLQILQQGEMNDIIYSFEGITQELRILLEETLLDTDLNSLIDGLKVFRDFRDYVVLDLDLKVNTSELFSMPERLEHELNSIGINNTNFWSLAAPRLQAGYMDFKPLFTTHQDRYRISNFVCQQEFMSKILKPSDVDVVTTDDIFGAVTEQFCGLQNDEVLAIVEVLAGNLNYTFLFDKVFNIIMQQVFSASNLTTQEGSTVLEKYSDIMNLVPVVQESIGEFTKNMTNEPVFEALRKSGSLSGLLSSPQFLSSAGSMLCGKPFKDNSNKYLKAVTEAKDFNDEVDPLQVDALPTDFCRDLYKDVLKMSGGKIIWSFVKPLIMGKIIYTPNTPTVSRIIERANSSFATISKMASLIHKIAAAFPAIETLVEHKEGVKAIGKVVYSSGLMNRSGGFDMDGLFDSLGGVSDLGNLLTRASNLLHCLRLDRFHPVKNEDELTNKAVKLTRVNEFSAGVVFTEVQEAGGKPSYVDYKIRMDIDSVPTTSRIKNQFWTPGPEANFLENMRYFRGFVQVQDLIDTAIIELASQGQRKKREVSDVLESTLYTQQIPYPCYKWDYFQSSLYESQALIVAFFFALVFSIASAIRFIVSEKESGNTMLLSIMGVNLKYHTLSWFLSCLIELILTCLCIAIVLCITVLPRSDPTLVLAVMINFSISGLAFCYLISRIFSSASFASVCGGLIYLVTFMPFVIILSLEAALTNVTKLITCLSMSTSFCYSLLHIARFEAIGAGAHWSDLFVSSDGKDSITIGVTMVMVLVDAALYFLVGWIIDRYKGIKTLKSSINTCRTSTEKAGVSIADLTVIYKEGSKRSKTALKQVNIELEKGQITGLLGHNGAGKTTLIKVITGMIKPTNGHVVIRSDSANGCKIGVCPQNDILYDNLTIEEHLYLYAQLKSGLAKEEVKDQVNGMLEALSCTSSRSEQTCRLSGGLRRRVCVSLAFLCEPQLVLLDEPSAGVDPVARREIWSLIMRLKEDRTVLMTTHHLDEAELLSDQIVIMHKGQVHTSGSTVEIKRSFGNGYKMSFHFSQNPQNMDEKSKATLKMVREVIKNAQVNDLNGSVVEMDLPFYDANGLNNDFLKLCTLIEENKPELGFNSFSIDCGSLEQVMHNICNPQDNGVIYNESATKSSSSSSTRTDSSPLVPTDGDLTGTQWEQFKALIKKRYLHYKRNKWLLFLLLVLPCLFVSVAMGFSMIRPPPDNEVSLQLYPGLYEGATQFVVRDDSSDVMNLLMSDKAATKWTLKDNPECVCTEVKQECNLTDYQMPLPKLVVLPNTKALNDWLISTQELYIEKRYGGYSQKEKNNKTNFIAWYNNKGHHALPSFINGLNSARLKIASGNKNANIVAHTHPLKISHEQLSKSNLLQHVADAGVSGMLLLAFSLIPAASAIYLVNERVLKQKRLQYLSGLSPALYWFTAAVWDMFIIIVNILITVCVLLIFNFPVFVARDNLPSICILLFLFGFSCNAFTYCCSRFFTDASMSTMVLFCGNFFSGLSGLALLLILDIISESQKTDDARWVLHKIFMLSPQFALGDGLLEIAKNTVQAQVLSHFGMDTYNSPLKSDVILLHYLSLLIMGIVFTAINMAAEYGVFERIIERFTSKITPPAEINEDQDVLEERRRVERSLREEKPLRLLTIGNINAGYVDTESMKGDSIKRNVSIESDVIHCLGLGKTFPNGKKALENVTFGLQGGQCTALLGENGAGKSTTFSILTGEIKPSYGKLYLLDEETTRRKLTTGIISFCPQENAIDPLLTVRETLQFYCQIRGIHDEDRVISRTLQTFDLSPYAKVINKTLSGGNKRKLCAAVAFMSRSALVLLDEPTSGMDPQSRRCVTSSFAREHSRSVLVATHSLSDAQFASKLIVMRRGRLVACTHVDGVAEKFGGGYQVLCRVSNQHTKAVWRVVKQRMPQASLQALHVNSLQFLVPLCFELDEKQVRTKVSEIFRLMAELQSSFEVEDYTINQSTLEQMFLSLSERKCIKDDDDTSIYNNDDVTTL